MLKQTLPASDPITVGVPGRSFLMSQLTVMLVDGHGTRERSGVTLKSDMQRPTWIERHECPSANNVVALSV